MFTRVGVVVGLPDQETETACGALDDVFNRSTDPMAVFYDPGTEFAMVKDFLNSHSIYARPGSTRTKRLLGMIETLNRVVRRCLERSTTPVIDGKGHALNDLSDWLSEAKKAVKDANHRFIGRLGRSPIEIEYGIRPNELNDQVQCPSEKRQALIDALSTNALNSSALEGDTHLFNIIRRFSKREHIHAAVGEASCHSCELRTNRHNHRNEGKV